jgi:aspartyl-tRNA(Asn)/glutamyl-tRNA(Gln) amidotransferase subunit A
MEALTPTLSVREQGRLLRAHEVSAVELTERALVEIEAHEPELNAFATVIREPALTQARQVDEALAHGEDAGPLAGIPVVVKDSFLAAGAATTGGSSLLRNYKPVGEADLVAQLRSAGAVLVGKTNMSEFGWGLDPRVGRVNNPLDNSLTAGGSSGGSAAAVASGSVAVAIGTDSGGSIRMPAAFCAVVGLKPTHGLIPGGGSLPGCWSLSDAGPIARSIEDIELLLDCVRSTPPPSPDRITRHRRLGLLTGAADPCKPQVGDAIGHALAALSDAGCDTTDVDLDLNGAHEAWLTTFAAEKAHTLTPFLGRRTADVTEDLRDLLALGASVTPDGYRAAQAFRSRLGRSVNALLATVDALVLPTVPSLPSKEEPDAQADEYYGDMRWTIAANLTGHPALTIPAARSAPVGLQLIGHHGGDGALLDLAKQLEAVLSAAGMKGVEA